MINPEHITFQNSCSLNLVGQLYHTSFSAIVIMAPGFCSDQSSQGRFEIYARGLERSGISVLTIDFSGCGKSDDEAITVAKETEDLRCAIRYVKSRGYRNIGLYGNSLGGLIALKAYSLDVCVIAMSGGPTGPMKYDWRRHFESGQMQELKNKGYITEYRLKQMYRKEVVIDKQMLADFAEIDPVILLQHIKCPVLLIQGDGDQEERDLYKHAQNALSYLPKESKLHLISGATHGFWGHIDMINGLLTDWFVKYLFLSK